MVVTAAPTTSFRRRGQDQEQRRTQDLEWGPVEERGHGEAPVGADNVWAKLLEASEHRSCSSPPCSEVIPPMFRAYGFHFRHRMFEFIFVRCRCPTTKCAHRCCLQPLLDLPKTTGNIHAYIRLRPRSRLELLCCQGKHIHQVLDDFGEEMAHVEGAVVVRRPDLIDVDSTSSMLAPAGKLDFARTLMSYFPLFKSSLCPRYGFVTWHCFLRRGCGMMYLWGTNES